MAREYPGTKKRDSFHNAIWFVQPFQPSNACFPVSTPFAVRGELFLIDKPILLLKTSIITMYKTAQYVLVHLILRVLESNIARCINDTTIRTPFGHPPLYFQGISAPGLTGKNAEAPCSLTSCTNKGFYLTAVVESLDLSIATGIFIVRRHVTLLSMEGIRCIQNPRPDNV